MTLNLNTLQKHYDKLTARERYPLIVRAVLRDDEADRRALMDTAPKVRFTFPHTIGLAEGFTKLIHFYISEQLGRAALIFMLIGFDDDRHQFKTTAHGEPITLGDAIELSARRFMEGLEAWQVICKEYNLDPALISEYCQHEHVLNFAEITIRAWYGEDYSTALLTGLESTIAGFREVIERERVSWSEAQAK